MQNIQYLKRATRARVVMPSGATPLVDLEANEMVMVVRELANGRVECMTLAGPCVLGADDLSRTAVPPARRAES